MLHPTMCPSDQTRYMSPKFMNGDPGFMNGGPGFMNGGPGFMNGGPRCTNGGPGESIFRVHFVDFWRPGQKMFKSVLLDFILSTSAAVARKYLNWISWTSFCRLLESRPENT